MAAHRYSTDKSKPIDTLSEILSFGSETQNPPSPDLTERIRKVKEKIEEMNARIQRLAVRAG